MQVKVFIIIFAIFILFQDVNSQTLHGFVRTNDGQPIEKVRVQPVGYIYSSYSDKNGYFRLEWKGLEGKRPIIFEFDNGKNYDFKILKIENYNEEVNVILEPKKIPIKEIPTCKFYEIKRIKLLGRYFILSVPTKYKTESGVYDHGLFYKVYFQKGKLKEKLSGDETHGALGNDYPPGRNILDSDKYEFKRVTGGFDWRGIKKNGEYWRFFQTFFENYSYSTDSKEAADFFDELINNVCFNTFVNNP